MVRLRDMAQTAQPTRTADDPLEKILWWVTAVIAVAGLVYFGVMAYLVFSTMNWDVLFGDLTSNPGGSVSAPAQPPPPPGPELMPPPGAPAAPAPPVAPAPAPPVAPPTPPR
jgi:hypothetical protein